MKPDFDLVVIGGGAGGLVVAAGGASLGARVALVEKHRLGGDCLWHGCVPSKTLIKSARVAHQMRHADRWGIAPVPPPVDLSAVMQRVAGVIRGIEPNDSPERFRALGVDVILGAGRFSGPDRFEAAGRTLRAKAFVIATGSRPVVPPIPGLEQTPYLTNETLFDLRENVAHLVVVGAGPIGCELAQAFRRLGSNVTVVDESAVLLRNEDPDLTRIVQRVLADEGVRFQLGARIVKADGRAGQVRITFTGAQGTHAVEGSHLLVAAGRKANLDDLGLDAAGVRVEGGRIVHRDLVTSNPRVFVVGDAAGEAQFTHLAEHHAGIVLRRAIFRLKWTKPSTVLPWAIFTDPELARVGLSESEAKQRGLRHRVYRFPLDDLDRARTEGETEGVAKLVTAPNGRLLGAGIVAPHAGELIGECALAIAKRMTAADLSATIHAYPTFSLALRRAADQRLKEGLTPKSKAWIRRVFRLQGA